MLYVKGASGQARPTSSLNYFKCSTGALVTFTTTSGTPPYSFSIIDSNGTNINASQTSPIMSVYSNGNFLGIIEDNLGKRDTIPVFINNPFKPLTSSRVYGEICNAVSGSIHVVPEGGASPYVIKLWKEGVMQGEVTINNRDDEAVFSALGSGHYVIETIDSCGNSKVHDYDLIAEIPLLLNLPSYIEAVSFNDGTVLLCDSLSVSLHLLVADKGGQPLSLKIVDGNGNIFSKPLPIIESPYSDLTLNLIIPRVENKTYVYYVEDVCGNTSNSFSFNYSLKPEMNAQGVIMPCNYGVIVSGNYGRYRIWNNGKYSMWRTLKSQPDTILYPLQEFGNFNVEAESCSDALSSFLSYRLSSFNASAISLNCEYGVSVSGNGESYRVLYKGDTSRWYTAKRIDTLFLPLNKQEPFSVEVNRCGSISRIVPYGAFSSRFSAYLQLNNCNYEFKVSSPCGKFRLISSDNSSFIGSDTSQWYSRPLSGDTTLSGLKKGRFFFFEVEEFGGRMKYPISYPNSFETKSLPTVALESFSKDNYFISITGVIAKGKLARIHHSTDPDVDTGKWYDYNKRITGLKAGETYWIEVCGTDELYERTADIIRISDTMVAQVEGSCPGLAQSKPLRWRADNNHFFQYEKSGCNEGYWDWYSFFPTSYRLLSAPKEYSLKPEIGERVPFHTTCNNFDMSFNAKGIYEVLFEDKRGVQDTVVVRVDSLSPSFEYNYFLERFCGNNISILHTEEYHFGLNDLEIYNERGERVLRDRARIEDDIRYHDYRNLPPGEYTIYKHERCKGVDELTYVDRIIIEDEPRVQLKVNGVVCNKDSRGFLEFIPLEGVQPFQYRITSAPDTNFSMFNKLTTQSVFDSLKSGRYEFSVTDGCGSVTQFVHYLSYFSVENNIKYETSHCEGSTQIVIPSNIGESTYEWSGPNGFYSFERILYLRNISYEDTGLYRLSISGACIDTVIYLPISIATFENMDTSIVLTCSDYLYKYLKGTPPPGGIWIAPNGLPSDGIFSPSGEFYGTYIYRFTDKGCVLEQRLTVIKPSIEVDIRGCFNDLFTFSTDSIAGFTGRWISSSGANSSGYVFNSSKSEFSYDNSYSLVIKPVDGGCEDTIPFSLDEVYAGEDTVVSLCWYEEAYDLHDFLGNRASKAGFWLESNIMKNGYKGHISALNGPPQSYHYIVPAGDCYDTAVVTVVALIDTIAPILDLPDTLFYCSSLNVPDYREMVYEHVIENCSLDSIRQVPEVDKYWEANNDTTYSLTIEVWDHEGYYDVQNISVFVSKNPLRDTSIVLYCHDSLYKYFSGNFVAGGKWSKNGGRYSSGYFLPTEQTLQTHKYTFDYRHCTFTASLRVLSPMTPPVVEISESGCFNDVLTVKTVRDKSFTYIWTREDGVSFEGGELYDTAIDISRTHDYHLSILSPKGCVSWDTTYTLSRREFYAGRDTSLVLCWAGEEYELFSFIPNDPSTLGYWETPTGNRLDFHGKIFTDTATSGWYKYIVGEIGCQDTALVWVEEYIDTTAPYGTPPTVLPVVCDWVLNDYVPYVSKTAYDDCSIDTIVQFPSAGTILRVNNDNPYLLAFELRDKTGNVRRIETKVWVTDTVYPTVIPINKMTYYTSDNSGTYIAPNLNAILDANDNCFLDEIRQSPKAFSELPINELDITHTVSDSRNIVHNKISLDMGKGLPKIDTFGIETSNNPFQFITPDFRSYLDTTYWGKLQFTYSQSPEVGTVLDTGVHKIMAEVHQSGQFLFRLKSTMHIKKNIYQELLTPNYDGKNDLFVIPFLKNFNDNSMIIYNREGHKVYEKKGYGRTTKDQWGGINENTGDLVPVGTYIFEFKAGKFTHRGSIIVAY